jgi:hypothetical protein
LRVLFLQHRFKFRDTQYIEIGKLTARCIHYVNCMDTASSVNCFT